MAFELTVMHGREPMNDQVMENTGEESKKDAPSKSKIFFKAIDRLLTENYKNLFKAGIVLFGVTLACLSQIYPKLIELDHEARKDQYVVEAQEKKKIKEIDDCHTLRKNVDKCLYAKYQLSSNHGAFEFSAGFVVVCVYFGAFMIFLAMMGFIHKEIDFTSGSERESA